MTDWEAGLTDETGDPAVQLIVVEGVCSKGEYRFSGRLTIGRRSHNEVCLPDPAATGEHAVIERVGPGYEIRDLDSKNGTFVNDRRIQRTALTNCDRIRIGSHVFVFLGCPDQGARPPEVRTKLTVEDVDASTGEVRFEPGEAKLDAAYAHALSLQQRWLALPDLERVLIAALEDVMQCVPAERGAILLDENTKLELKTIRFRTDVPEEEIRVPRSVVTRVVETGKPIVATFVTKDPYLAGQESVAAQGIRSLVAMPLQGAEGIGGLVYLDIRTGAGVFDQTTFQVLWPIARALAVAVQAVRERDRAWKAWARKVVLNRFLPGSVVESIVQTGSIEELRPASKRIAVLQAAADIDGAVSDEAWFSSEVKGFLDGARASVFRHGGTLETAGGPQIKAVFGYPGSSSPGEPGPLRAGLEIVRQAWFACLSARAAGESPVIPRAALEVGEATVGFLGAGSLFHLHSAGPGVQAVSSLLELAARGEVVVGPGAVELWGPDLVRGRSLTTEAGARRLVPGTDVTSVVALAPEPAMHFPAGESASGLVPVRCRSLKTGVVFPATLICEQGPERSPALGVQKYPETDKLGPGERCLLELAGAAKETLARMIVTIVSLRQAHGRDGTDEIVASIKIAGERIAARR